MEESHHIRSAAADELHLVRDLARAIWPVCYAELLSPSQIEYMLDRMYSLEQLQADQRAGISFDLLFQDERPIGFAAYGPQEAGAYKLHKLYLLPCCHGRGLGSRLVRHVIAQTAAAGGATLSLQVNKQNQRAIAVYEKAGFQRRASICVQIGGGFVMDDYVLVRPLSELLDR